MSPRKGRAAQIDPAYATCRDLMHSWQPLDAKIDRRKREVHRILQCTRCPMKRTQVLRMDGTIKLNRYNGPKDYYLTGGQMTKDERAALRLLNAGLR